MDTVIEVDANTAKLIAEYLATATRGARFAIDDGGVKVSVDRATWTPPLGSVYA